uniref:Putative secreted protein n=1 Tax=Haematobia irritans TaxID=7368 RepID=A0A1L8EHI3_HAEIR
MKAIAFFFVVIFAILALSRAAILPQYSGQPGCKTHEELQIGVYRHFKNKTAYWQCTQLGVPASLQYCPNDKGFLETARACVPWAEWYWTPTVAPPSSP